MPFLTTWAPFCAMVLPMWTMLSAWSKQSHGCSCPGCKATNHTGTLRNLLNPASGTYTNTRRNSSEPSGTFRTLPLEPTPTRAGTLRNPPEPSKTFRNQPFRTFRNLPPEPTPAYPRNLPEPASGTYTSTRRNSPEPSGTFRNLPESSGTFRNLPPEPAPATRTGTHRSLSGLKTPLAYAVGEKYIYIYIYILYICILMCAYILPFMFHKIVWVFLLFQKSRQEKNLCWRRNFVPICHLQLFRIQSYFFPNAMDKISFGGIPNSSSIRHFYAFCHLWLHGRLFAQWFCPCGQC